VADIHIELAKFMIQVLKQVATLAFDCASVNVSFSRLLVPKHFI